MQRHHLLPRELLRRRCFAGMFAALGPHAVGFEDFRRNGLLLPARSEAAQRLALPLHRGPHRHYTAMVVDRVGQIEAQWARNRGAFCQAAGEEALFRLALLQNALRRRLLDPPGRALRLNRHDPLGNGIDFSHLDAMAEMLWSEGQAVFADSSALAD